LGPVRIEPPLSSSSSRSSDAEKLSPASLVSLLRIERKWWSQSLFCCDRIPTKIVAEESPGFYIGKNKNIRYVTRKAFQADAAESLWASLCEKLPLHKNDMIGFGPLLPCDEPSRVVSFRDQVSLSFAAGGGGGRIRSASLSRVKLIGAGRADATAETTSQLIGRGGSSHFGMCRVVFDILCFQAVVSAHMVGHGASDPLPSFSGRVVELLTEVLWETRVEMQQTPEHPLCKNISFLNAMNLNCK
jgi:hypothetical protein